MQDLNDKITGGTLLSAEWNEVPGEIQNVIESLGITLSVGDLNQLGKAIAGYVANGDFYTDSGAANSYVLTQIGNKKAATAYTDGFKVRFVAANDNTSASTVNVAGLGVKSIKLVGGADPGAGAISGRMECVYDIANDRFELAAAGDFLQADQTDQLTVGFTSTVASISGASYAVDFSDQHLATWPITANITVNEPIAVGQYGTKLILVSVDGTDRSISAGADVVLTSNSPTNLSANTDYELFIRRYSDSLTVVDVVEVG